MIHPYNMIVVQWHITETSVTHQAVCVCESCISVQIYVILIYTKLKKLHSMISHSS